MMEAVRWGSDEADRRRSHILKHGIPCRTRVDVLNDTLLVVIVEPTALFPHLVQNEVDCVSSFGPYHISVCQSEIVSNNDLMTLRDLWEGRETTLVVTVILSDGFLQLGGEILEDPTIARLHNHVEAWYSGRDLHASA